LGTQIEQLEKNLEKVPDIPDEISKQIQTLSKNIESKRIQLLGRLGSDTGTTQFSIRRSLLSLYSAIARVPETPSKNQLQKIEKNTKELKDIVERINEIIETDIRQLNRLLNENNIPFLNIGEKVNISRYKNNKIQ